MGAKKKRGADHCQLPAVREVQVGSGGEVPAHIVLYLQLWKFSQYTIQSQMADADLQIKIRLFLAKARSILRG